MHWNLKLYVQKDNGALAYVNGWAARRAGYVVDHKPFEQMQAAIAQGSVRLYNEGITIDVDPETVFVIVDHEAGTFKSFKPVVPEPTPNYVEVS